MELAYDITARQGEIYKETVKEDGLIIFRIDDGNTSETFRANRAGLLWLAGQMQTLALAMEKGSGRPKVGGIRNSE